MKVTCLCLTRNRRNWLPQAIQCFLNQTYQDRELLIVSDGEHIRDLIPEVPGLIRHIVVPDQTLIGTKRNIGCDLSSGDLIAHWDDDDFSGPQRLDKQVPRLAAGSISVTGYHSLPFTDGTNWWQYSGTPDFAIGASLLFRRSWWERNPFEARQVGEDNAFVRRARDNRQILGVDDEGTMAITIHPGNTCARSHLTPRASNWKQISAPAIAEQMQGEAACSV